MSCVSCSPDSAGALASAKYVLTSIPPLAATLYDVVGGVTGVEAAVQCAPVPCLTVWTSTTTQLHVSALSRHGRCTHCVCLQALAAQHRAIRQAAEAGGQPALGYLSSTGVYGDWGGDWVDER